MRLQPILGQIVALGARLCRSEAAFIHLADDGMFIPRASVGLPSEFVEYEHQHPDKPGPHSLVGRVAMTKKPAHIPDAVADPD